MTPMLALSESWMSTFPGAGVGLLAMNGVQNSPPPPALQKMLAAIEEEIRERYAGSTRSELQQSPALKPYLEHYRRHSKTYHVLLQLESVAQQGRAIGRAESLVSAMFGAELDTLILTAGHDVAAIHPPLVADVTRVGERYVGIGGKDIDVKPGDMTVRDSEGILSTVLYGPDDRSRLRPETVSAMFTAYAPRGIDDDALERHLRKLERLVAAGSPSASTASIEIRRA